MNAQKLLSALIGIAMVTTLILPGRSTPAAIDAAFKLIAGPLRVAMGA